MKRLFANATRLGCIALLALSLQNLPLQAKDNGKDKLEKPAKAENSGEKNPPPKFNLDNSPIQRQGGNSFAPVIKKAAPSVVSVFSSRTVQESERNPLLNDPLLRRFFGGEPDDEEDQPEQNPRRNNNRRRRSHQEMGLGSGVIVTENGYILTNNHVIEEADDVKVETSNGTRYTARVIGTDAATDMALIKIDAEKLPAMTIGDSEGLEVGDVVLAIGNPFGIGQTVTMGIISAVGRTDLGILGNRGYEDFIQTDAAINMGNSGGALIDAQGRLIGINAAILSRTGGNVGVGFAVPVNMARHVIESLTQYGHVSRGFLGIKPRRVTTELARQFNLSEATGALVEDFPRREDGREAPSVAREAGLKIGDVIVEFNGKKITDDLHLRLIVSQTPPNTESTVKIIRDGKEKVFKLTLAELPSDSMASGRGDENEKSLKKSDEALEGVAVDDLDKKMRSQFRIPPTVEGAVVTDVDPDSKSYEAGLRPGDVIMEIDRKPVRDAKEAVTLSENVKGPDTLLRIYSRGNARYLTVENGTNEPAPQQNKDSQKSRKSRR
jgi:serine protease Do